MTVSTRQKQQPSVVWDMINNKNGRISDEGSISTGTATSK